MEPAELGKALQRSTNVGMIPSNLLAQNKVSIFLISFYGNGWHLTAFSLKALFCVAKKVPSDRVRSSANRFR